MRVFGFILLACLILTGLQVLVTVLVVATVALLCFGLVFQPRQTLTVLGALAGWALLVSHPWLVLSLLAVAALVRWWRDQPPG